MEAEPRGRRALAKLNIAVEFCTLSAARPPLLTRHGLPPLSITITLSASVITFVVVLGLRRYKSKKTNLLSLNLFAPKSE